jgi:DNA topoisomerase-1
MKKGLLIVESPTKARTLQRYLGNEFDIRASVGHVKDLPKKRLGVDIDNNFTPEYEIIQGKAKILKELNAAAAKVTDIYLAPDPDREGEAIAWHIAEELKHKGKSSKRFHRVLFHEFTARAIEESLRSSGSLDRNKFESQQARRILDRLVGYEISPLLWDKVRRGLSAGRVQSVAVRIICDREREIQAFVTEEYWTVHAALEGPAPPPFKAKVIAFNGKKLPLANEKEARAVVEELRNADFRVAKIQTKERKRQPQPPFITSTMQQDAARALRFQARKTMMVAQRLYEGMDIGDEGPVGLITYMRTDSTRVASEAVDETRSLIKENFGADFVPSNIPRHKQGKRAQDAHEAIRPTSVRRTPQQMAPYLDKEACALYELIWKRFVASQMNPAIMDQTRVDINADPYLLRATGTVLRFPGFTVLYTESKDEGGPKNNDTTEQADIPLLSQSDILRLLEVIPKQHFTQPPPRYTEASLIRILEEKGIGRPSTYATILSTIRGKDYVRLDQRHFVPTELGLLVTDLLVAHFPEILDTGFTAEMEKELDGVEEGSRSWTEILSKFYGPFTERLDIARGKMRSIKLNGAATEITCDKCGAPMVIKYGKSGEFLSCSTYPQCKNTADFARDEKGKITKRDKDIESTGEKCDKCGLPMVVKKGKFGEFLGCSGFPACRNTRPISTGVPCPEKDCTGELVKKQSKGRRTFYGCSQYPKCNYAVWNQPVAKKCPKCGFKILVAKSTPGGETALRCPAAGCDYRARMEKV